MGEIYSSFDFGYDPDTIETCPIATLPPPPKLLPSRATANGTSPTGTESACHTQTEPQEARGIMPYPPFAICALHKGNSQNLQLVAIGTDGRLYLPARQCFATGQWTEPSANPLSFQDGSFSDLALGSGNNNYLQVLARGEDQRIYLAAWQDATGAWQPPSASVSGPLGDPGRAYAAVTACRGNSGFLQVFGLGVDGKIYLVAWQDQNGCWYPPSATNNGPFGAPGMTYTAMVAANGNSGFLQVIGLGVDRQIYLTAWQDQHGAWHQYGTRIGNPGHTYTSVAAANGNKGYLQVLGLGTDQKVYLAAWQDNKGAWHVSQTYGGPLGNESRPYTSIAPHMGADGNLQVVCLGAADGKAYLPVYQDKSGKWYTPSSAFYGPLGDPMATYQQLVLANGDQSFGPFPGNLQVVGLGSGDADDGLPYLVSWQGRNGHWHSGGPLGEAASPLVNWQRPTGQKVDGGCVAFGRFWVTQGSSVISFDTISGTPGPRLFPFGNNASPRVLQPYNGKLGVICDDGNLYLADPNTSDINPLGQVGIPIWAAAAEGCLFVAGFGGVFALAPDGIMAGPYGQGIVAAAPAVAGGVLYIPVASSAIGSKVVALDAATLSELWSIAADGKPGSVFCDGSWLCFTTASQSLYVYDVGGRKPVTPNNSPIGLGATSDTLPILNGGTCYVAFNDAVQVIDVPTGKATQRFGPIQEPVGTPVMSETGVLFYGSIGPIAIVDTTADDIGLVTYDTGGWPFLAAHQDGALFYAGDDVAAAVRLDELTHQFYVETSLIRDFDFSGGTTAPSSTPNFQVEVALFNADGSPRPAQPVRITGTAAGMLTYRNQTMPVSPTTAVDVVTDGAGRLRLAVAAGTQDRSGTFRQGLTAPELLLTSPFIDARVRFVIRPHGQLQQQLATITSDQLSAAKGYDEQNVISDAYRADAQAMTNATKAINETSAMVRTSMEAARKRSAGDAYCDPACDMTVACCMPASDPSCPVVCDQSFLFDLTLGASQFRLLTNEEASTAASEIAARAVLGSWDDFWDDVKTGAVKVVSATIEAVVDGAQATIHFVTALGESVVQGVIRAAEHAVLLVQGIFNTIATAVERVVEAVSFLFDWEKIVDLHNQISTEITTAWNLLGSGSKGVSYDTVKTMLDQQLGTLKQRVDCALQAAKAAVGSQSVGGAQAAKSGQPNAAIGSCQGNWLLAKMQDNITPAMSDSTSHTPLYAAALPDVVWPQFQPSDQVMTLLDTFVTTLGNALTDDIKATIDRVREDLDPATGSGLFAQSLSVIIDVVQGLIDVVIDLGQTALLMDLLKAIMAAVNNTLAQEVCIPYVSDLYEWATKSKLTLLDLFSLIVAIPAGFAMKLICREPAYASGVSPLPPAELAKSGARRDVGVPLPVGWLTIVAGCAQSIWSIIAVAVAGIDLALKQGYGFMHQAIVTYWRATRFVLTLAALGVVRGAFCAAILVHQIEPDPLVWVIWALPTIVLLADAAILLLPDATVEATKLDAAVMVYGAIAGGGAMALFGAIQFSTGAKTASDVLALLFAISVGVSLLCRLSRLAWDPKVAAVLIAIGAAALLTSGILEIVRGAIGVSEEEPARGT